MACLTDFIGLTGCGSSTPASGLFINSLPGISLKSVAQLADEEQKTYLGVWADVQARAIARLELSAKSLFSKEYRLKTVNYSTVTNPGDLDITNKIANLSSKYIYGKIATNCTSPLQSIYIKTITFYGAEYTSSSLLFIDKFGNLLNISIAPNIDQNKWTWTINHTFNTDVIYFRVSTTDGGIYNTTFSNPDNCCVDVEFGTMNQDNNGFYPKTWVNNGKNYGTSVDFSVNCSFSNLICSNQDTFAYPLWYLCGSEMMLERLTSDRVNKYTVDRKQAEELKAYYDAEAEKALKLAIDGIDLNEYDCCIQCDPPIAVREAYL